MEPLPSLLDRIILCQLEVAEDIASEFKLSYSLNPETKTLDIFMGDKPLLVVRGIPGNEIMAVPRLDSVNLRMAVSFCNQLRWFFPFQCVLGKRVYRMSRYDITPAIESLEGVYTIKVAINTRIVQLFLPNDRGIVGLEVLPPNKRVYQNRLEW